MTMWLCVKHCLFSLPRCFQRVPIGKVNRVAQRAAELLNPLHLIIILVAYQCFNKASDKA
jgi:hypothetical protein